jgi:hypothetical protein
MLCYLRELKMIDLTKSFGMIAGSLLGKPLAVFKPLKTDFNPAAWEDARVVENTNCYAYALNCPQMGWARPGNLRSLFNPRYGIELITVENIRNFMKNDGLEELSETEALSSSLNALALRISDRSDYHFYRLDSNGLWSHKQSYLDPSSDDDRGDVIKNPRTAASRSYAKFGGYFTIPENGILYVPRLQLPAGLIKAFG